MHFVGEVCSQENKTKQRQNRYKRFSPSQKQLNMIMNFKLYLKFTYSINGLRIIIGNDAFGLFKWAL